MSVPGPAALHSLDWNSPRHPWQQLTTEDRDEGLHYFNLDTFRSAANERRRVFEEDILRQQRKFERAEARLKDSNWNSFAYQLLSHGAQGARNRAVPAYAFENFRCLPLELQLRIWTLATRVDDPKTHTFVPMLPQCRLATFCVYDPTPDPRPEGLWPRPPIMHIICPQSSQVASSIYMIVPCIKERALVKSYLYCNPSYDNFYIGGRQCEWDDYRILVDILIQRNATRAFRRSMQECLDDLRRVRNLIVDIEIFARAPSEVWMGFPKVENFTIVFHPFDVMGKEDIWPTDQLTICPELVKPQRGTKYGKRAEWLEGKVVTTFKKLHSNNLHYKIPIVQGLVHFTGDMEDDEYQSTFMDQDEQEAEHTEVSEKNREGIIMNNGEDADAGAGTHNDDDWFENAEFQLNPCVLSRKDIKSLKCKVYPSRKVETQG